MAQPKDQRYKRNQPSKSKGKPKPLPTKKWALKPSDEKPQIDNRAKPRDENAFTKVYGINACKVFYKNKFPKIIRAFFTQNVAPQFSELMKQMAAQKKVYRIVPEAELEKVSQSQHHEGVCFNVETEPAIPLSQWLTKEKQKKQSFLLALENIGNPHNLGAIMRVAAHFGVDGIAMTNPKALQSGAAKRTAEGGAEFVQMVQCESMKSLVQAAKKEGYFIATTSSHKGKSLYKTEFPDRCILLFGEEGPGLSKEILNNSEFSIQIPGTNNVESLNVSAAIAIILGEIWSQKKS